MSVEGLDAVLRNLAAAERGFIQRASRAAAEIAAVLEAHAKTNHPWTRDTGATDASTIGTWEAVRTDLIEIVLAAGMDYDVFLELARSGQWAWLWPTLEANRDEIMSILSRWMSV